MGSGASAELAYGAPGINDRGEYLPRKPQFIDHWPAPLPLRQAKQAGGTAERGVDGAYAAESEIEPFAEAENRRYLLELFWVLALHPQQASGCVQR